MGTHSLNIPSRLNTGLSLAVAGATLAQVCAPLALAAHPGLMAAFIVLLIPVNLPFWSLIHEAVHKHLYEGSKLNETAGRLLSILFGIPFASALGFGARWFHRASDDHYRRVAYVIIAASGLISLPIFDGLLRP